MPFQFNCPNGHLLEALESQAGDQCTCPHCAVLFIIPDPPASGSSTAAAQVHAVGGGNAAAGFALADSEEELLHIPCPNGHVLDVPPDMLEQDVLCPHCQAQFRLRRRDSAEYKERKQREQELRDARAGTAWLNWAIAIAIVVVLGLAVLIAISAMS